MLNLIFLYIFNFERVLSIFTFSVFCILKNFGYYVYSNFPKF